MPDFDRFANESKLARSVRSVFDELLLQVEGRRPPVWDDFARGIQRSFDEELLAVYVVVFLMMADGLDPLVASSMGSSWSRARSMEIASELTHNVRREIANGRDPSAVLSDSRIAVLSATEITRAISKGQTDARSRRAAEEDPEARGRSTQSTRSTDPAGAEVLAEVRAPEVESRPRCHRSTSAMVLCRFGRRRRMIAFVRSAVLSTGAATRFGENPSRRDLRRTLIVGAG